MITKKKLEKRIAYLEDKEKSLTKEIKYLECLTSGGHYWEEDLEWPMFWYGKNQLPFRCSHCGYEVIVTTAPTDAKIIAQGTIGDLKVALREKGIMKKVKDNT